MVVAPPETEAVGAPEQHPVNGAFLAARFQRAQLCSPNRYGSS